MDFERGDRVTVRVDNPAHGDYWANGLTGVVESTEVDAQEDHVRHEVRVRFNDTHWASILHYNLEKDES